MWLCIHLFVNIDLTIIGYIWITDITIIFFLKTFVIFRITTIASTTNIQRYRQINAGRRAAKGFNINISSFKGTFTYEKKEK